MKTKLSAVALVASAITIAQANPGDVPAVTGTSHRGAVARTAPAVHAPMRPGGVSSFRSTPMRSSGSRPFYSGQRYSSFGMRSSPAFAYRQPIYSSRGSFTRSGPYTVATIPQRNRVAPFANRRNPAVTPCGTSETLERSSGMETICGTQTIFGMQTIAGTETISEMETTNCGVTGRNTFSLTNQGIGIAIGTATATIGGMATNAPSLMDRG